MPSSPGQVETPSFNAPDHSGTPRVQRRCALASLSPFQIREGSEGDSLADREQLRCSDDNPGGFRVDDTGPVNGAFPKRRDGLDGNTMSAHAGWAMVWRHRVAILGDSGLEVDR